MIPSSWFSVQDWMRIVAGEVNQRISGYPFPSFDAAPASVSVGFAYYDTALKAPSWYDGTAWKTVAGYNTDGSLGYFSGGGTVIQGTSRTTAVTLNKVCGAVTLFSAAGSAAWTSFTVNNSLVEATDTIMLNQKSGTDKYMLHVTSVGAGTFQITFATTGGTATEQPIFKFALFKTKES